MTVSTLFTIKKTLIFGFIKLDKVVSKNKALFASNDWQKLFSNLIMLILFKHRQELSGVLSSQWIVQVYITMLISVRRELSKQWWM